MKMASGSNRSLPHHEIFDPILPESAFYLDGLSFTLKQGNSDLLRLSSRHYCGGPSHAVSQLPEECSRRKHHLNSETASGPNWPIGCLTFKLTWSMKHRMIQILMRVQSLHTTTPFLKYTRITQCHYLSWFAASASSKAAKKTNSPVFSALATWQPSSHTPKLRIGSKGQISKSQTGLKRSWPKRSSLNMKEAELFCCECECVCVCVICRFFNSSLPESKKTQ